MQKELVLEFQKSFILTNFLWNLKNIRCYKISNKCNVKWSLRITVPWHQRGRFPTIVKKIPTISSPQVKSNAIPGVFTHEPHYKRHLSLSMQVLIHIKHANDIHGSINKGMNLSDSPQHDTKPNNK